MRMITASFVRAIERLAGDLGLHFLSRFQQVVAIRKTCNQLYRNSANVTEVANRLLKLKNARFGSVDRESNYLVRSHAETSGTVLLLADTASITGELNQKTRQSTRFAVVVMHPEQKPSARAHFQTPLIFSIQEAKGLE